MVCQLYAVKDFDVYDSLCSTVYFKIFIKCT